jgi:hypothetical protein
LLVAGCWLLVAGCWLLVAGCWLLVAGLLVAGLLVFEDTHTSHDMWIDARQVVRRFLLGAYLEKEQTKRQLLKLPVKDQWAYPLVEKPLSGSRLGDCELDAEIRLQDLDLIGERDEDVE